MSSVDSNLRLSNLTAQQVAGKQKQHMNMQLSLMGHVDNTHKVYLNISSSSHKAAWLPQR